MSQNDGGPAFPSPDSYGPNGEILGYRDYGMSLRDWYAGKALQSYMADYYGHHTAPIASEFEADRIAQSSFMLADAMLAERSK